MAIISAKMSGAQLVDIRLPAGYEGTKVPYICTFGAHWVELEPDSAHIRPKELVRELNLEEFSRIHRQHWLVACGYVVDADDTPVLLRDGTRSVAGWVWPRYFALNWLAITRPRVFDLLVRVSAGEGGGDGLKEDPDAKLFFDDGTMTEQTRRLLGLCVQEGRFVVCPLAVP